MIFENIEFLLPYWYISLSALNETSITLPKIDILGENITNIIDTQYWTKISKMIWNSIKIIGKWNYTSNFIK